jgi:DNA-binding NarL/FixJ family response regulator
VQGICNNQSDLQIAASVATKMQALALANQCDVILVSHGWEDALDLVQAIGKAPGGPGVVVMGLPNIEALILRYLESGAAGCVREQDSLEQLVKAIRLAAAREAALTADMVPMLLRRVTTLANRRQLAERETGVKGDRNLTPREREILRLIAEGYGNREIARELTIELGTAKNHVHNILDKLKVKTRQDAAVCYALGMA